MKFYPIFTRRATRAAEELIDSFIPDDREFAEFLWDVTGVRLCASNSSKVAEMEARRILYRRLGTSGRYEGDQDYEFFKKRHVWTSTRGGDRPPGWTGVPKWGYTLGDMSSPLAKSKLLARKYKKMSYFKSKVEQLKSSPNGSYGRYRSPPGRLFRKRLCR